MKAFSEDHPAAEMEATADATHRVKVEMEERKKKQVIATDRVKVEISERKKEVAVGLGLEKTEEVIVEEPTDSVACLRTILSTPRIDINLEEHRLGREEQDDTGRPNEIASPKKFPSQSIPPNILAVPKFHP